MNIFEQIGTNKILISAVLGCTIAQVLKTLIFLCINKPFRAERLVGGGGMPSSHSATVCALATAAGITCGLGSIEFAICFIFAMLVMYDAMGVRRETGIQAQVLNEMMDWFKHMGKDASVEEKLKEFVGHTPIQVYVGAILGIIIACLVCL